MSTFLSTLSQQDAFSLVLRYLNKTELFLLSLVEVQFRVEEPLSIEEVVDVLVEAMIHERIYVWLLDYFVLFDFTEGRHYLIFNHLFSRAYTNGHLAIVKHHAALYNQDPSALINVGWNRRAMLGSAAKRGDAELLSWIYASAGKKDDDVDYRVAYKLAKHGHLALLVELYEGGFFFMENNDALECRGKNIAIGAGKGGHRDILQWMIGVGIPVPWYSILRPVIKGGNLEIFKWVVSKLEEFDKTETILCAIRHGNLEILKFSIEEWGWSQNRSLILPAVSNENPVMLRWLFEKGIPIEGAPVLSGIAAMQGYIETLSILYDIGGIKLDPGLMRIAVRRGYVPLIEYLLQKGLALPDDVYKLAERANSVLLWLLERNHPFSSISSLCIIECSCYHPHKGAFQRFTKHEFNLNGHSFSIEEEIRSIIGRYSKIERERGSVVVKVF